MGNEKKKFKRYRPRAPSSTSHLLLHLLLLFKHLVGHALMLLLRLTMECLALRANHDIICLFEEFAQPAQEVVNVAV